MFLAITICYNPGHYANVITFADPGNSGQTGRPRVSGRITPSGDSALLSLALKESYFDATDGT